MDLRSFLLEVANHFDRNASMSSPTQLLLRHADNELAPHVPGGLEIIGSGGQGGATFTPWVGVFDPDETSSPQEGVYVVYLFATDLESVTLSLNQGMERLRRQLGNPAAREKLAQDAAAIRGALQPGSTDGLSEDTDLGPGVRDRQKAYMAANIACVRYEVASLPAEHQLRSDLARFIDLYQDAVAAKRMLLQTSPGSIASASSVKTTGAFSDPLAGFKPKDDSDYVAHLSGQTLIKTRRHERLVQDYGEWCRDRGLSPATEHPKDLVVREDGSEWLVEAKIVRHGNATEAVRAALGQLFTYRHFLYDIPPTGLVGLFSEPIGEAYTEFFESSGVGSVWREAGSWAGSHSAMSWGLCGSPDQPPTS